MLYSESPGSFKKSCLDSIEEAFFVQGSPQCSREAYPGYYEKASLGRFTEDSLGSCAEASECPSVLNSFGLLMRSKALRPIARPLAISEVIQNSLECSSLDLPGPRNEISGPSQARLNTLLNHRIAHSFEGSKHDLE